MRPRLVLLSTLLLLAAFGIAVPAGRASGPLDEGSPPRGFLPLVAKPPEPASTPAPTYTLTPSATPTETQTFTPSPTATETLPVTPSPTSTETPTPTITPTPTPSPTRDPNSIVWDPRLDQRGAKIIPAQVYAGQWYWRLVKGVWYAENEEPYAGQHHIFVDARTADDQRRAGVPFNIASLGGNTIFQTILTEMKPPNEYAANFPMYVVAPAYRAISADGSPADAVTNLGMGSIELPDWTTHTSYGFTWQWSQATATTVRPDVGLSPAPSNRWMAPW